MRAPLIHRFSLPVAVLAGGLLLPLASSANECSVIGNDAERLACYDRRHAATAGATSANGETAAATDQQPSRPALISGRGMIEDWDLAPNTGRSRFELRTYKPVYLLVATYTDHVNNQPQSTNPANSVGVAGDIDATETQFQLSVKTKMLDNLVGNNGNFWIGYTQISHWQIYNEDLSRPFRETNYEPEAMLMFRTPAEWAGWNLRVSGASLNHQSNGRSNPLSRSWNRVIGHFGLEKDGLAVQVRPWWRIPEDAAVDNNPGIENYIGRGEVIVAKYFGSHSLMLTGRHSLRGGDESRGSLKLQWGIPVEGNLRLHVSLFSGYGDSLINYNHRQTMIGAGVSLVEF